MSILDAVPLAVTVHLARDASGAIRVGNSRVLLELVIRAFRNGDTPESIVQSYDTLSLVDVYALIGYYLNQPDAIDEYVTERSATADVTRQRIEAAQPARSKLRETLMMRAKAMEQQRAATPQ
jgi:uncharacterized protein (DUF433 family)